MSDAILYHTEDMKLQKKIIGEDLSYVNTIKYGLAFKHSQKKVEEIHVVEGREGGNS